MLAVVSVLGPVLPITIVKLVVPPTAIVLLATALVRLGVTARRRARRRRRAAAQVRHVGQRRQRHRVRVPVGPRGLHHHRHRHRAARGNGHAAAYRRAAQVERRGHRRPTARGRCSPAWPSGYCRQCVHDARRRQRARPRVADHDREAGRTAHRDRAAGHCLGQARRDCTSPCPAPSPCAAQVRHVGQRRQRHRVRVPVAPVACTTIVTVTVPPVGMVTLPRTVVPLRLNAVGTSRHRPWTLLTCVAVRLLPAVCPRCSPSSACSGPCCRSRS
jgi:hypothetical protein